MNKTFEDYSINIFQISTAASDVFAGINSFHSILQDITSLFGTGTASGTPSKTRREADRGWHAFKDEGMFSLWTGTAQHVQKQELALWESLAPPYQLSVQTWHKHFTCGHLMKGEADSRPVGAETPSLGTETPKARQMVFMTGNCLCLSELCRSKPYEPRAEISDQLTNNFFTSMRSSLSWLLLHKELPSQNSFLLTASTETDSTGEVTP